MLEFVHLSGASAGKDLQTRRKVRSQAMRDFRRRQRAEREAVDPSLKPESITSKQKSSKRHSRDRSASAASAIVPERRRSSQSVSPKTNPTYLDENVSLSASSSIQTPSVVVFDDMSANMDSRFDDLPQQATRRTQSESSKWLPQWIDQPSPVSRSHSTWGPESSVDPFQSPAQINQMFNFCKSYIHWLRPGVDPDTAGSVLSSAWETSQCPMLLAACCLASVGHLDAVQPNRPGGNYHLYKARVLREVSQRMQSSITATSDETIGTLGCLLSFEMSRGSGEALTHLRGLRSIINMKGGMESLSFPGITRMIETLDLLHAAIYDTNPILTQSECPTRSNNNDASDADAFSHMSALLTAEQEAFQLTDSPYRTKLQQLPDLLDSAIQVLKTIPSSKTSTNRQDRDSMEQLQQNIERFNKLGIQEQPGIPDAHHLARACHLHVLIFYNLVVHRVPHRHRSNQEYADALFSAFRCIRDQTWDEIPYLRLWVLLTGAVASHDLKKKSFFKAQLVRGIYQMGPGEFRRVKEFMIRYLELKQSLERPARRATPPMELITSPTADQSYLYASWPDSARSSSPGSRRATNASIDSTLSQPSPHYSRDPSPMSQGPSSAIEMPRTQNNVLYEDMNIDPFLKYDSFDTGPQVGSYSQQAEQILASDRAFHNAIYKGDLNFMEFQG